VDSDEKLCECGCGQPAPIATITNRRSGAIKGVPQRFVPGHHLKRLAASKRIELTGQRFGRLTAVRLTRLRRSLWEVQCECGTVLFATSQSLRTGKVTSCGAPTCRGAAESCFELRCAQYLLKPVTLTPGANGSTYRVRCGPLSAADQANLVHAAAVGMAVRLALDDGTTVQLSRVSVNVIAVGWVWIEGLLDETAKS
jgi:hypothetical protein